MDGKPGKLETAWIAFTDTFDRDLYRSSNIVIQNSVINNGDGMMLLF
jgi:hypothetical protein